MPYHSTMSLRYIANRLQEQGADPKTVLLRHGLDLNNMALDSRIECSLELQVFCELCELSNNPLAGLSMGNSIGFSGYGPFAMMLLTCATPYEALLSSQRFQALAYLFSKLTVVPGKTSSALTFTPLNLPGKAHRLRIDTELAGAYKLLLDLQKATGIDLQPEQVVLPYNKPEQEQAQAYPAFFNCPVLFTGDTARIEILNSKLQQALPTADLVGNQLFRQQCEQLQHLALQQVDSDLANQVRQYLLMYVEHFPSAPEVASMLQMSERSLRSNLSKLGVSYRQILDQVRYQRACQHLEQGRDSIESIALQLGYAEAAAFIHAFQRWSGTTPAAYRRQIAH